MIDNIKITLRKFKGNLSGNKKLEPIGKSYKSEVYKLYNHEGRDKDVYLLIKHNAEDGILKIENSIRKWYLGGFTLLDLTERTANKAFSEIAKILDIDMKDLCKATFTQCEIGLIIRPRIPVEQLVPMVVKYSTFKRYNFSCETVGFKGEDLELKMYDKTQELLDKNKKKGKYDQEAKKKAFKALSDRNYNFFRMEFDMFDKQSFENKDMVQMKTIGDILDNYLGLYSFWVKEISRVILLNRLVISKDMTPREYILARVLEIDGFVSFEANCLKRGTGNARSRLLNEALAVIAKFSNLRKYNANKFKVDILKNLRRIGKKEENLNVDALAKILFKSEDDINRE
ncbi:hypothetical protein [Dysgonomonas capnocytophagoides]|uniref:hypothetical protein n=1 Tax=Dysgonomonas capnocytophagoides TaxID=45254 RepID=UPI0004063931|nr:hypothetical protein [Dysgonomonas capnocytophagoides]